MGWGAPGRCSRTSTEEVEPDLITVAKRLGAGMPIVAAVGWRMALPKFKANLGSSESVFCNPLR